MTIIERRSVWAAVAARGFIAVIGTVCALGILLRLFVPAVVEEAGPWVGLVVPARYNATNAGFERIRLYEKSEPRHLGLRATRAA